MNAENQSRFSTIESRLEANTSTLETNAETLETLAPQRGGSGLHGGSPTSQDNPAANQPGDSGGQESIPAR